MSTNVRVRGVCMVVDGEEEEGSWEGGIVYVFFVRKWKVRSWK